MIIWTLLVLLTTAQPTATIQKPQTRTVKGGTCRVSGDVFGVNVGPNPQMPTLALTIGPAPVSAAMHANMAKFAGPVNTPTRSSPCTLARLRSRTAMWG